MSIENIVVGVDFSEESDRAVQHAVQMARHNGAQLTLLHASVVPELAPGIERDMKRTSDLYPRIVAERVSAERERLDELRRRISGQGVTVSQMISDDFADTAILEAAKQVDADLVVVGTHGRTGIKRFLLGSVAEKVVRVHDGAVMVARGDADNAGFARILVPTDFSPGSEHVFKAATDVAAPGARITLLHCWRLPPLGTGGHHAHDQFVAELRGDIATAVKAQAAEFFETHKSTQAEVNFVETEMPPGLGVQTWLEDNECDLVVMGSHGRRGVRRFILGSVAETTVRHAPCSVLVVRGEVDQSSGR